MHLMLQLQVRMERRVMRIQQRFAEEVDRRPNVVAGGEAVRASVSACGCE